MGTGGGRHRPPGHRPANRRPVAGHRHRRQRRPLAVAVRRRPTTSQARQVRARHRTCVFPGCRRPARSLRPRPHPTPHRRRTHPRMEPGTTLRIPPPGQRRRRLAIPAPTQRRPCVDQPPRHTGTSPADGRPDRSRLRIDPSPPISSTRCPAASCSAPPRSATSTTSAHGSSPRSAAADVVFAEDTRRTRTLLGALGITPPPLRSFYVGNENRRLGELRAGSRPGRRWRWSPTPAPRRWPTLD